MSITSLRSVLANGLLVLASVFATLAALEFGLRYIDGFPLWPGDNLILARADRFVRRAEAA